MAETNSYSLSLLEGNVPRYASIDIDTGGAYTALFGLDISASGALTGYGIGLSSGTAVAGTQYVVEYNSGSKRFYLAEISSDENPGILGPSNATAAYYVYGPNAGSAGWVSLPTGIPYLTNATTMKSVSTPSSDGNYVLSWNSAGSSYALISTSDAATITGLGTGGSAQNCLLAKQGNAWTAISYPRSDGTYNLEYSSTNSSLSFVATQAAVPTISRNLISTRNIGDYVFGATNLDSNTTSIAAGLFPMSDNFIIHQSRYAVTLGLQMYIYPLSTYEQADIKPGDSSLSTMAELIDGEFSGETNNTMYNIDIELRLSTSDTSSLVDSIGGANPNSTFYAIGNDYWSNSGTYQDSQQIITTTVVIPSGTPGFRYITKTFFIESDDFKNSACYCTARMILNRGTNVSKNEQRVLIANTSTITFTPCVKTSA